MTARRLPLLEGGSRLCHAEASAIDLRSVHALLVKGLQVPDHLRNHADKLARDISDILLRQLPLLLSPAGRGAERRLELRHAKLPAEVLQRVALAELTEAQTAALHGRILQLWLALQHSHDLRDDRQDLS